MRILDRRIRERHVFNDLGELIVTVLLHDHLVVVASHRFATPLELVIPDRLGARLRNREREAFLAVVQIVRTFQLAGRSEEHTSELQSLMRTSYAVFCLKKKN